MGDSASEAQMKAVEVDIEKMKVAATAKIEAEVRQRLETEAKVKALEEEKAKLSAEVEESKKAAEASKTAQEDAFKKMQADFEQKLSASVGSKGFIDPKNPFAPPAQTNVNAQLKMDIRDEAKLKEIEKRSAEEFFTFKLGADVARSVMRDKQN